MPDRAELVAMLEERLDRCCKDTVWGGFVIQPDIARAILRTLAADFDRVKKERDEAFENCDRLAAENERLKSQLEKRNE